MVHYELAENVLVQEVLTETVLLDTHKGEYFELNEVGTDMLKRLRATGDPEQALARLMDEFQVDHEELAPDFYDLISQLTERGLLKKSGV